MKTIKNDQNKWFQIGDYVRKGKYEGYIEALKSCEDKFSCEGIYRNFHVCGGYKRVINKKRACVFSYRADGNGGWLLAP